jgi:fatty acid desaturase
MTTTLVDFVNDIKNNIQVTDADVMHELNLIIYFNRILLLIGMITLPYYNLIPILCLGLYTTTNFTIVAHHTIHGGFDNHDKSNYYKRGKYAYGIRRFIDWFDPIYPEAWNKEHNYYHHFHLNESDDPDLVIRNVELIREINAPMIIKYLMTFAMICSWKYVYYASNSYAIFKSQKGIPIAVYRIFSESISFGLSFLSVYLPWVICMFYLVPLVYSLLLSSDLVFYNVLFNIFMAETYSNIHSFIIIVTNHCGEDVSFYSTPCKPYSEEYFKRAIEGSVNFDCGNRICDYLHGYLNYQIEHHMFPDLSILHYKLMQPHIKKYCLENGIKYKQQNVFIRLKKTIDIFVGNTSMINYKRSSDKSS